MNRHLLESGYPEQHAYDERRLASDANAGNGHGAGEYRAGRFGRTDRGVPDDYAHRRQDWYRAGQYRGYDQGDRNSPGPESYSRTGVYSSGYGNQGFRGPREDAGPGGESGGGHHENARYGSRGGERGSYGQYREFGQGSWSPYAAHHEYGPVSGTSGYNDYESDHGAWPYPQPQGGALAGSPEHDPYGHPASRVPLGYYGNPAWGYSRPHRGSPGMGWSGDERYGTTPIGSPYAQPGVESGWSPQGRGGQQQRVRKSPKGYTRSDERIREDVNDRLMMANGLDPSDIEVQVNSGEVRLIGSVEFRHEKFLAEQLAEAVPGVKDIENRLRVQSRAAGDQAPTQVENRRGQDSSAAGASTKPDSTSQRPANGSSASSR